MSEKQIQTSRVAQLLRENRQWLILIAMTLLAAFVFTTIGRRLSTPSPEKIALASQGWETSEQAAVEQSQLENKLILVDFTADWCPPCKYMKYEVFTQEPVRAMLAEHYVALRADVTAAHSAGMPMAQRYNIRATPTLLVIDAQGRELARQEGGLSSAQLIDWLKKQPHAGS